MTPKSMPSEARVNWWHCYVCRLLKMTGDWPHSRTNACLRPKQMDVTGSECLSWVCGVHYQEGSALRPTIDVQKHSLKFTVRGAPCILLISKDTQHPKSTKKQQNGGNWMKCGDGKRGWEWGIKGSRRVTERRKEEVNRLSTPSIVWM